MNPDKVIMDFWKEWDEADYFKRREMCQTMGSSLPYVEDHAMRYKLVGDWLNGYFEDLKTYLDSKNQSGVKMKVGKKQ